ncbi:MAG: adenylate/guanylate cyclase domain-containing protein [Leptospiraceae bacterium]|nr:adenylate/guanylate cyclase domain-containing protein [Leptospiraceae bacterium]
MIEFWSKFMEAPSRIAPKDRRYFIIGNLGHSFGAIDHLAFLLIFIWLQIPHLVYINIVSIIIFITSFFLNRSGWFMTGLTLGIYEIILHQVLAIIIIGNDAGFEYYIIAVSITIFLMPGHRFVKTILSFSTIGALIGINVYGALNKPIFPLSANTILGLHIYNGLSAFGVLVLQGFYFHFEVKRAEKALELEHEKAVDLLHNILPVPIAKRLQEDNKSIADGFEHCTVLFADIVGFTKLSQMVTPERLVEMLNEIFSLFDDLAAKYDLEKIKTIGDCYMVAGGIPIHRTDHAEAVADFALDMIKTLENFNSNSESKLQLRIGINSGPVVAGVIGKRKFIYDLWGDTVNTASRMESHGVVNRVQVSESTYELLNNKFNFEDRGTVNIKGKGDMRVYLLLSRVS